MARTFIIRAAIFAALCAGTASIPARAQDECGSESDCPLYHYCSVSWSPFVSRKCQTNLRTNANDECRKRDPASRNYFLPDNAYCQQLDVSSGKVTETKYSTSMCFKGGRNGYFCSNAYYMPCLENYDLNIPGYCPVEFGCQMKQFVDGQTSWVCVPNEQQQTGTSSCKEDFDCGFNAIAMAWTQCASGILGHGKCRYLAYG